MNNWINNLKKQLIIDEGVVYGIYKDSVGRLTFGIGHLLLESDEEYNILQESGFDYKKINVSPERVDEVFLDDVKKHIDECRKVFADFDNFDDELKEIIANMMFNLGYLRFLGFKNFISAVKNKKYFYACEEMVDSKWFLQVGDRSKRLLNRMINLGLSNI